MRRGYGRVLDLRRVVSTVAVLAAWAAATPAAHAAPAASTVVVVAGAGVQETSFATVPGEPYLVTVTGVFEGFAGARAAGPRVQERRLYDCGWWFDPVGGGASASSPVSIDDHAPACTTMPYTETHTYQWTEIGTGAPFRFVIDHDLLSGGLVFTVSGARASIAHAVTGFCLPHPAATPLLDYVPIVVEAGARAGEPASAVSTYVVCDVTGASGESAHLQRGLPGPAVETAERMTVPPGDRLTVCSYGGASWDDGVDVTTSTQCYQFVAQ